MRRILVIEDNTTLAYGLRNNLEIEGHDVKVAETGQAGLDQAAAWNPDLVILDLMLPDQDGFLVLRSMMDAGLKMPVLILTARGEQEDKVRGLRLGAEDYVTKPFGLLELLARVEVLLRRSNRGKNADTQENNPCETFGDIEIRPASRTVFRRGKAVELAPKELDLLLALVRHRGSVVSRGQLLQEVWGYPSAVVTRTVDTHVAELRRKLEDHPSSPRHILTVRKAGYRLQE
ncbi:MAG: response regulator transcription factor [Acidobacteria bacterium]|nr:response regulator transcription factor [Acidobacteriota bacterium]MCZ6747232.1 response regulator transcription factor [Acidobacteriota bacterium]MCZ6834036.1 response regulator transcription factor [Acidobacteriota bacterium]